MAGYHEVMYTEDTKAVLEKKFQENKNGKNPQNVLWRISSTLFSHIRHDVDLSPMKEMTHLHDQKSIEDGKYPKMNAHEKLLEELRAINLAPKITIDQMKS